MATSTLRPTTTAEVHGAVMDTASDQPRLAVHGARTAAAWGGRPGDADAVIDTTALHGVLQYNPADMTIAIRAGTPLADVQAEVSEAGQRLAFAPARGALGATVGGLLATADGCPSRLAYGTLRDLIIGVTVVLADGTVARSGGHVIKNVAGYDLGKLFSGSLGTLGVITEVVLRLHPRPRATATVAVEVPAARAYTVAGDIATAQLEPVALELVREGATATLLVRFEGTEHGVGERAAAVAEQTGHPSRTLSADEADTAWNNVDSLSVGGSGDTVLRLGSLPSDGMALLEEVSAAAADGVGVSSASTLLAGVHTVLLRGGGDGAHDAVLRAVHGSAGAACTTLRRDGLAADTPLWGPPPPAVALMRAIKQRFDPQLRFDPGPLVPWLAASPTGKEQSP